MHADSQASDEARGVVVGVKAGLLLLVLPIVACVDEYYCSGSVSCHIESNELCERLEGCRVEPVCEGVLCALQKTESACDANRADCAWRQGTGVCEYLRTCEDLDEQACRSEPSCAVRLRCRGAGPSCDRQETRLECSKYAGCHWGRRKRFN